jgi:serine protease inhibitor
MNEEGTEAAAGTYVQIGESASAFIEENPRFEADHPFVFVLANGELQMLFNGIFDG